MENSDGDPDGADGGVETLLGEEDPSLEGERGCLEHLLSSIAPKRRKREENPKRETKDLRDGYQCKTREIFIVCKMLWHYNNGC
jgi:hypothetical protein